MSQEELVHAYLQGNVSRRTFIRRLVAAGVSMSAAVAYVRALRPTPARAEHNLDHYEAPSVITTDATDLAGESANLTAQVDPNRFPTTVWFEFGATPSYGIKTSDQAISGNGFRPVGASVVGLDPGRLYHFRAVATNQIGQTVGEDRTFAIPDAVQPSVGLSPVDTDLDAVEKARVLRVLVSSEEAVELSLTATMRRSGGGGSGKRAPKRIVVARGNLTMEREGDGVAQLALTRAGRRALKGVERAKLSLQVTATDLAGNSAVSGRRLALSR